VWDDQSVHVVSGPLGAPVLFLESDSVNNSSVQAIVTGSAHYFLTPSLDLESTDL